MDNLELMKQEIIEVIKKYIDVEEEAIDVRLTNEIKEDGTTEMIRRAETPEDYFATIKGFNF